MFKRYDIQNYNDFVKTCSALTKKEKGDLFEELTWAIFKYHHFYHQEIKHVWLYKNVPSRVKKYLNLPDTDQGIDLILQDDQSRYYAVQCKYRTNVYSQVKWSELGTFSGLSFGTGNNIFRGYLVTNTYSITDNIKNSNKIKPIYGDFFTDENLEMVFAELKNNSQEPIKKSVKLRSYQMDIVDKTVEYFNDHDRGYISMACGTGKTLTSYRINRRFDNRFIVIAVPSLQLANQFYNEWAYSSKLDNLGYRFLIIGSDSDVENKDHIDNGLFHTTDRQEIKHAVNTYEKLVLVVTYQSSHLLKKLDRVIDLCIFDEAHKTVGNSQKLFGCLLKTKVKITKRLFMTATPKFYLGNDIEEKIYSMDDKNIYGDMIAEYQTGQAIQDGYLCDYQVNTFSVYDKIVKKSIKRNKIVTIDKKTDVYSHYLASAIAILDCIKRGECSHVITYHQTIKNCHEFAKILEMVNEQEYSLDVFIHSLNGGDRMVKRTQIIKEFESSKFGIICNARVLNEGVNIPIINGICFVDNKNSKIDIVQSIGRGLRLYKNKKLTHIILPILVSDEIIKASDINNSVFSKIIQVLRSLKEYDSGISEYFLAQKTGKPFGRKLFQPMSVGVKENISTKINLGDWARNIGTQILEFVNDWENKYCMVKKFLEKKGRYPSDHSKNKREKSLGSWCNNQRANKKKGILSEYRIKKLKKLDEWYWDKDDIWDKNYYLVKKFTEKYNRLPSYYSKNIEEKKSGIWCANQRQNKRKNKLSKIKIKKLEELDGWFWDKDDIWDENYYLVKKFTEKYNRIPSSESKNIEEKSLGYWCSRQRSYKRENKLSKIRIKKLKKLDGWFWDKDDIWDENYYLVKKFIKENNRLPSVHSKNEKEKSLGHWCSLQRSYKRLNKLSKIRIKKLKKLDGWFWNMNLEQKQLDNTIEMVNFINKNNRNPSTISKDELEKQLGIFRNRLLQTYRGHNKGKFYPATRKYLKKHYPAFFD